MTPDAAAVGELSRSQRRALLKKLLAARSATSRVRKLSYAQQRLWFLDRLDPGAPTYNIPVAVRFRGRLRMAVLARVLKEIVRRHETLRTVFVERGGEPGQVVSSRGEVPIRQVDLRALRPPRREAELRRLSGNEVLRPFDLARGPLARLLLLRPADSEQVAVLTLHHIIADGWSMGVLVRELGALYAAFDAGLPSPLPEPPIQYVDFAHWQRRHLDEERLRPGLSYWQRELAGELPLLDLPTDRPRPANTGFDGRVIWFRLPLALVGPLRKLAERFGGTLFMVLLGAFTALLARYSGQRQVLVGSPVANRHRRELEGLIGVFVNTLVLRCDLRGDPLFIEFLERVRETTLGALAHQEVPFERLVETLRPDRDLSRHPLFQVIFVLQNVPFEPLELPGLTLEPFDLDRRAESFDMTLSLVEVTEGIFGSLTYNTDLFDPTTMRRLLGHLEQTLRGVSGGRLSELELLTPAERQQFLERWHAVGEPAPASAAAVEARVLGQATRTPEACAVLDGGRVLSYGALAAAVRRLARRLRKAGVGAETVVGVALEPGAEAVVAMLAVLHAGGAYLPLDLSHPPRRVRYQVELCRVSVVITRRRCRNSHPELGGLCRLLIDVPEGGASVARAPREAGSASERLAYVLFTSGSTGEPKGVAMSHGSLSNLLVWQQRRLPLAPGTAVAQLASLGFDVSFQEIFSTLSWGGTLVVVPEALRRNPDGWPDFLDRRRIERFFVPFAGLERLADAMVRRQASPRALHHVVTAGEQLLVTDGLARWCERSGTVTLHNHYGPTESHVVTSQTLGGPVASWPLLPPIGRPIDGAPVRVLDPRLQPVPDGLPGELFLAGVAPARGYFGRPSLTAGRFLPDPWSAVPGGRLYRSGDRGRQRPRGEIEFEGRADRQLKIRGFRIEPGEVEAALTAHPALAQAAVVARRRAEGELRLAAFVVGRGKEPAVEELRGFLLERLPEYMVPAAFVFLESLPTTASGKVDRRALPGLPTDRPRLRAESVAARNSIEERLSEVFSQVLSIDTVGVHDHFLELGGDSILALQLITRAQRAGFRMTLEQLFAHPTVAGLAEVVAAAPARARGGDAGPRETEAPSTTRDRLLGDHPELEDLYPLSPMQKGILFHHFLGRETGEYLEYFRSRLHGLDVAAFRRSWEEIVARHPALRTVFFWDYGGEPLQGVLGELPLPLDEFDLRALDGPRQEAEIRSYVAPGALAERFDPGRAPLFRLALFRLTDQDRELVWSFHDLILDGWSGPLVLNQVAERYEQRVGSRGTAAPAPRPKASPPFRRYVDWLARQDPSPARDFWRRELAGYEPPLQVEVEASAAAGASDAYDLVSMALPVSTSERVRSRARRGRLTLNTLVQAAWGMVLCRWLDRTDLIVGSVVSGRSPELPGVAEIVGVVVNTLPIRLRLEPGERHGSWLEKQQRLQIAGRRFEHVSLVDIHRWSGVPRTVPLFESIVAFVNYPQVARGLWRAQRWSPQRIGYPLFLLARPDDELYLELNFDRRRFRPTAARRMLNQLRVLLLELLADPRATLETLPWLPAAERHQLLVEWNDTRRPLPEVTVLLEIVSRVRDSPERIAAATARGGGAALSYGELARRAAGVASVLEARGVGPGAVVPLLAPRGLDFLVAVLALWHAGAAYLPLDPEHPPERLRRVIGRSGSRRIVVSSRLSPRLAAAVERIAAVERPRLLELESLVEAGDTRPPRSMRALSGGLAYTIFTSGSTGVPKGAMVSHRGMLNHLLVKIRDLDLGARDRVAQTASQCFDISVWQLVAALLVGGRVEIFGHAEAADPERLPAALTEARVTVFETVPSLLRSMLEAERRAAPGAVCWPAGLRWLMPTGEALPPDLCRRWLDRRPEVPLVNAYGPTECSDDVTHHVLRRPLATTATRTPIGRPIANTRIYLLDRRLAPVPQGGIGELYVAGTGVGQGYLGEGRRTASAFIPDPFGDPVDSNASRGMAPGGRLYATGDRACRLPDGTLEFHGRLDHQVKVRGFRIELAEVEKALGQVPGIAQAAVVLRPDAAGHDALAACVVPAAGSPLDVEAYRRALRSRLPDYMLPTSWLALESLPLLPSGKVDRAALARRDLPELKEAEVRSDGSALLTATEEVVLRIWSEVLRRSRIRVEDDFFELGGHSLLATQVLSRVRALGADVPLRRFFEMPTARALAAEVDLRLAARESEQASSAPAEDLDPLRPSVDRSDEGPSRRAGGPSVRKAPLSFAQQRLWFAQQWDPGSSAYNLAASFRLTGDLRVDVLERVVREIVRRHAVLRTTFQQENGEVVQQIETAVDLCLPLVDLGALRPAVLEQEEERLVEREARRPFDLTRDAPLRVMLVRLRPERHMVLATLHHIVSDGWSMGVLSQEIGRLYEAFARGEPSPLRELPLQYADFAAWQRARMSEEAQGSAIAYWRRQLAGAPERLELPADRPRAAVDGALGGREIFMVPFHLAEKARRRARTSRVTLFMILLAAFKALLLRLTGQDDLVLGTNVANRRYPELEGIIGFFVNMLVLRTDLSGDPTFEELLIRVRDVTLAAYDHQDLPFEKLVEELRPERRSGNQPLFQVVFSLHNAPNHSVLRLPGLQLEAVLRKDSIVKYDLVLNLAEELGGSLSLLIEYRKDMFDVATIERLQRWYQNLLASALEFPGRPLSELEYLADHEREIFMEEAPLEDLQNEFNF